MLFNTQVRAAKNIRADRASPHDGHATEPLQALLPHRAKDRVLLAAHDHAMTLRCKQAEVEVVNEQLLAEDARLGHGEG